MARSGITIISEEPGEGPKLKKGDRVRVFFDVLLNRGDVISADQHVEMTIGDREFIAGFQYGLEGMNAGGKRRFKASPHLCYRDLELTGIPKNAVLIFDIKEVQFLAASEQGIP